MEEWLGGLMWYLKAIGWIKTNITSLLLSLSAILAGILTIKHYKRKAENLEDELSVSKATKEADKKTVLKDAKLASANEKREEAIKVSEEIKELDEKLAEAESDVEGMTDEEIAEEFKRLGF